MTLKDGPLDWTGKDTEVGTITVPVHLYWLDGRKNNKLIMAIGGGVLKEDGVVVASFKTGVSGGMELGLEPEPSVRVGITPGDMVNALTEFARALQAKVEAERKERERE